MRAPTLVVRLIIFVSASLAGHRFLLAAEHPDRKVDERVESTPDIPQTHQALPGNGDQYCAPVSASNGLAWLANHGYPKLMPTNQIALAKELGSPTCMNTSLENGTGTKGVVLGLAEYVANCGYQIDDLAYQGWRSVSHRSVRRIPGHANPVRVGSGLHRKGAVLLNIGWYRKQGVDYERLEGHWVTLVGSEKGDTPILIIHDSSSRSPEGQHERVTATRIRAGMLVGSTTDLPVAAKGAWELGGELKVKTRSGADVAILDSAVLLRLK